MKNQPKDAFDNIIEAGDIVDVQTAGEFEVYEEKGELWFTPYGKPERPMEYFMNDMIIVKKASKAK